MSTPTDPSGRAPHNPLPGPQPYSSDDRAVFFGREIMTLSLSDVILSQRVLTVFGPSGAGKSSLLRAGVVPHLVEGWDLRPVVVDAWPPERILYGGPVARLAEGLCEALDLGTVLTELGPTLALAARRSERPVLLVLDQLEQLLVHHELPVLTRFVAALEELRTTSGLGLHIVLALREDYLGRWTTLLRGSPALIRHSFRVPRLGVADMTRSVIRAAALGVPPQIWSHEALSPLISAMSLEGEWRSDETEVESAYVQIVCRALWEHGGPSESSHQTPAEILEAYLQDTLQTLGPLAEPARELLEDRLITRSGARVPITRSAALEVVADAESLDRILGTLEQARILRAHEHHGDRFFELGHDWLARPIQESAQIRRQREAERIAARKRSLQRLVFAIAVLVGLIIFGLYLQAERRRAEADAARTEADAARAQAETDRGKAELDRAEAVRAREHAEMAKQQEVAAREQAVQARLLEAAARAEAEAQQALAHASARYAREQEGVARGAAGRAQDTLHMLAVRDLSGDPTRAAPFLLGVNDPTQYPRWLVELLHVLQRPLATTTWAERAGDPPTEARLSPDGSRLAIGFASGRVVLRSGTDGAPLRTLDGHNRAIRALRWSPDGRWIASASEDGTARVWSARDGESVALRGHAGRVWSLAWSPDGHSLATTSEDGTARIWSPEGGEARAILRHAGPVWSVAWSPDGASLVTASADGTARRWATTGAETAMIAAGSGLFQAVWLPDAGRVLLGAADGQSWVWRAGAATLRAAAARADDYIVQIALSPDGRVATSRARDGAAVAWVVPTTDAPAPRSWPLVQGKVGDLALGGETGDRVALAVTGGPAEIRRIGADARPTQRWVLEGLDDVVVLDQADNRIVTVSAQGAGRLWPIPPGLSRVLPGVDGAQVTALAFSSDGRAAMLRLSDGQERAISLDGSPAATPSGARWSEGREAGSPDGAILADGGADGRVRLFLRALPGTPAVLDEHAGPIRVLAWSPTGDALISASDDGTVRLWPMPDAAEGRERLVARGVGCVPAEDRRRFLGESSDEARARATACAAAEGP